MGGESLRKSSHYRWESTQYKNAGLQALCAIPNNGVFAEILGYCELCTINGK